jgi:carboxyl-terminal processing protease
MIRIFFILFFFCCASSYGDETLDPLYSVKAPESFSKGKTAFANVVKLVQQKYYDSKGLTEDDLFYAAIKGILRKISPPKSPSQGKIWSASAKKKALGSLKTKQVSAGIKYEFDTSDGSVKILSVEENSAAWEKLLTHDRIMRINGKPLVDKSKKEVSALLSAKSGEVLKLKVVRDIEILDVSIEMKPFKRKYSSASEIKGCGYVRLSSFSDKISNELKDHLDTFVKSKCKNLILDLRHNTGGYFTEGVNTAKLFLKKGTPILSVVRSGSNRTNYVSDNENPYNFKIAVLVDRYSASSSEIVASALKHNNAAVLVGDRTYGKAITEKTFDIKNGYYIKFTVGAMYDIHGGNWHENGLQPDLKLVSKINDKPEEDAVVLKAISYLEELK